MAQRTFDLDRPLDVVATLGAVNHGPSDPTTRLGDSEVWRATRTADGPATVRYRIEGSSLVVEAWGDGTDRALEDAPTVVGLASSDAWARGLEHPAVARLLVAHPGVGQPCTGAVFEALVGAVLEQRVTAFEAQRGYEQVVQACSAPAPGPGGLWLPPDGDVLASIAYYDLHVMGVEQVRAETLVRLAASARRIDALAGLAPVEGRARLAELPGVDAGTAAGVAQVALGDTDAVRVGDPLLAEQVTWALTGEASSDDERLLEVLEPFAPNRGRVVRLVEIGGDLPERHGPRYQPRDVSEA